MGEIKTYDNNILKKMETIPASWNPKFKLSNGSLKELEDFMKKGEYYDDL
ncbi:hypothetical protein FACS1894176_00840 [Bacteroidia bacterium]|nr:hypothetical protein FACS1894176_00840 [Bacteroidia bacterium]